MQIDIDPRRSGGSSSAGTWTSTSDTYEVVDPNTTSVVGHAPEATVADAEAAIAAANHALPGWRSTPMADRCALLGRLSDILAERSGDWASLVQAETGATMKIARDPAVGRHLRRPVPLLREAPRPRRCRKAHAGRGLRTRPGRPRRSGRASPAGRGGRLHHPLQLPARERCRQDRSGSGDGQHLHHQAGAPGPARHPAPRRGHHRRRLPAGRGQRPDLVGP